MHFSIDNMASEARSDGRENRASASASVDSGFDSESSQNNDLRKGIHRYPYYTFSSKEIVLSEPSNSVVVPLGKPLNGIPLSKCGRQMASNS